MPRVDAAQDLLFSPKGQCGRTGNPGPVWHIRYRRILRQLRAGADQAHIASKNIDELRQFVQLESAQNTAEFGYALIALFGEPWTGMISRPLGHAPEFVNRKEAASQADTLLYKQRIALRTKSHTGGDRKHRKRQQAYEQKREYDLQAAPELRAAPAAQRRVFQACFEEDGPIQPAYWNEGR